MRKNENDNKLIVATTTATTPFTQQSTKELSSRWRYNDSLCIPSTTETTIRLLLIPALLRDGKHASDVRSGDANANDVADYRYVIREPQVCLYG